MSRFFIECQNGEFIDHPVSQSNLELIYPGFDPDHPVTPYVEFFEARPRPSAFEVVEDGESYKMTERGAERDWAIRQMTEEEKAQKVEYLMSIKPEGDYYLDENTGRWKPVLNQAGSPPDVIG